MLRPCDRCHCTRKQKNEAGPTVVRTPLRWMRLRHSPLLTMGRDAQPDTDHLWPLDTQWYTDRKKKVISWLKKKSVADSVSCGDETPTAMHDRTRLRKLFGTIQSRDLFPVDVSRPPRWKKVTTFFSRREKIFFSHHRRLAGRRDAAIFRFFPALLCIIHCTTWYINLKAETSRVTFRRKDNQSRLKVSSIFTVVKAHRSKIRYFRKLFSGRFTRLEDELVLFWATDSVGVERGTTIRTSSLLFLSKLPKDTDSERILDKVGGGSAEKGIFSRWKIDDLSLAMGCLYIETVRCSYDNKISNNVIHTNRWGDEKTISFTVSSVHSWSEMKKRLLSGVRRQLWLVATTEYVFESTFFKPAL